jgi:hypothetical protein
MTFSERAIAIAFMFAGSMLAPIVIVSIVRFVS